ncbi:unnamed protein product [Paramecium primaurelia]|uniref:Uncharacterized protein n=1 Tax=Paramecium primaurelia TaxID=5886 RepID=A0A8S1QLR9_PARPR|nr:unnamed protein product [Paramecium primaurelia]
MQVIKNETVQQLVHRSQYNKIVWQSSNPYNKRRQYKFKNAYYTQRYQLRAYICKDIKRQLGISTTWMGMDLRFIAQTCPKFLMFN